MPQIGAWSPEVWSALAAWVTALIAAWAVFYAWRQVGEARRTREEQAQPYAVAYLEPSGVSAHFIDLVVRNFGATAAHNVVIQIDPMPRRTVEGGGTEDVWLFGVLPVLVPGQEWRTLWDIGRQRQQSDLPDRHEAVVFCEDSRGKGLPPMKSVLDWGPYKGRRWVTVYGVHDAAKALREINKKMGKWQENIQGRLSVVVRDGMQWTKQWPEKARNGRMHPGRDRTRKPRTAHPRANRRTRRSDSKTRTHRFET